MSKTELTDNLTFASAMQMLKQLVAQGFLSDDEGTRTRQELERKGASREFHPSEDRSELPAGRSIIVY